MTDRSCLAGECIRPFPCDPTADCGLRSVLGAIRRQGDVPVVWEADQPLATAGSLWVGALADLGLVDWETVPGGVIARAREVAER